MGPNDVAEMLILVAILIVMILIYNDKYSKKANILKMEKTLLQGKYEELTRIYHEMCDKLELPEHLRFVTHEGKFTDVKIKLEKESEDENERSN